MSGLAFFFFKGAMSCIMFSATKSKSKTPVSFLSLLFLMPLPLCIPYRLPGIKRAKKIHT